MGSATPRQHVVVLGAGVIGLQTAVCLLEAGLDVTIVARDWPGDQQGIYTSMWAGAQWRSTSKMHETHMQDWERLTFTHWQDLAKNVPSEETGLEMKPAIYYWWEALAVLTETSDLADENCSRDYTTPLAVPPEQWIWWTSFIPSYKVLSQAAIPATGSHAAGISYDSFNLSPAKYLKYLLSRSEKLGVKRITAEVESIAELFHSFDEICGVVNCTGLGATKFTKDPNLYPTKGQSVIVRGEAERIATGLGDDWEAVVVPRYGENETFLGVSKVFGDGSLEADESVTQSILKRCKAIAPELLNQNGEFEVLSVQVGLRPTRTGGARVETEWIDDVGNRASKFVCHNYGHHGAGFEESFGTAKTVVELVTRELAK